MTEPTSEKLAKALAAIPGVPDDMATRARAGHYDDYKSELAFPLMQLTTELIGLAALPATPHDSRVLLREMIRDVANGVYDGTKEEAEEWGRSPEGQEAFRDLLGFKGQ